VDKGGRGGQKEKNKEKAGKVRSARLMDDQTDFRQKDKGSLARTTRRRISDSEKQMWLLGVNAGERSVGRVKPTSLKHSEADRPERKRFRKGKK